MNYQNQTQKKKKLNTLHLHQSVGTQPEENYSLDSLMEKSEYGNLNKHTKTKSEKINDKYFIFN